MKTKKFTALIAALVIVVCALPNVTMAASLTGSGTKQDPYVIKTAEDLVNLSKLEEVGYATLENDIDMSNVKPETTYIIKKLTGEFDGKGHTVSNLAITSQEGNYSYSGSTIYNVGFVGELSGKIKNLKVSDFNFTSIAKYNYAGALAGCVSANATVEISDCIAEKGALLASSSASSYTYIGGLIGYVMGNVDGTTNVTLKNNISDVDISGSGSSYGGGVIGASAAYANIAVNKCAVLGDVTSSGSGKVCGVVGYFSSPSSVTLEISDSYYGGKLNSSSKYAIGYHSRYEKLQNITCTNFYYDKTLSGASIDAIYGETVPNCMGKATDEIKALKIDGFETNSAFGGYPVPKQSTSNSGDTVYSVSLTDNKTAIVSAAKEGTYYVVFAAYKGSELIGIDVVSKEFTKGTNQSVTASDDFNYSGADKIKALFLRSLEDIYPLCEAAQK